MCLSYDNTFWDLQREAQRIQARHIVLKKITREYCKLGRKMNVYQQIKGVMD